MLHYHFNQESQCWEVMERLYGTTHVFKRKFLTEEQALNYLDRLAQIEEMF